MKIYVFEEGSCRGSQFGSRRVITIKEIETLAAFGDDEEARDEWLNDYDDFGDAFAGLIELIEFDEVLTYEEVIEKLKAKEYIGVMREESLVGYGRSKILAQEGYMSVEVDMERDWDE